MKNAMGHGDLPIDAYSQVWEECYNQVKTATPYIRTFCIRTIDIETSMSMIRTLKLAVYTFLA